MMTYKFEYPEFMTLKGHEYRVRHLMEDDDAQIMEKGNLLQSVYTKYVNLRYAVGGAGCNKMPFYLVSEKLQERRNDPIFMESIRLTQHELDTVLYLVKTYVPMVK